MSEEETLRAAVDAALAVRERAYCPYSGCKVGAVVKAKGDPRLFAGCNVENSSYGATICAERGAVSAMVAALGRAQLELVVVATDAQPPWPPCGVCRQVLAEFGGDDLPVHLVAPDGARATLLLGELLPHAFRPDADGLLH
jgi:homotetrameric cytidine deaminase